MTFTLAPDEQTDAELLHRVGTGDPAAAARLWVRLWPEALEAARGLVDPAEVPGLAAEALVGTLAAVALGTGPTDEATGFVVAAVHELGEDDLGGSHFPVADHPDVFPSRTFGEVFGTLPDEDQQLLRADGSAAAAGPALGRLQESYLRRHAAGAETPDCVDTHAFLGAATAAAPDDPAPEIPHRTWVHLSECAVCTEAFHELAHSPVALVALLGTASAPAAIPVVAAGVGFPSPLGVPTEQPDASGWNDGNGLEAETSGQPIPLEDDEQEAVVPVVVPARRRAERRWRRPLVALLAAAIVVSVVGVAVGVSRQDDEQPAASAAPEAIPTDTDPAADAVAEPADPASPPTETPTPTPAPTQVPTLVNTPTATAVATAAAAATTEPVTAPKPASKPTRKATAKPTSPAAPKPTSSSSPSAPATTAPASPAPTPSPTKTCNALQKLFGCR
ncbi:hypothetical protein [Marmoricola sp. RAF53]|uniref:hypothetical protein n=1 Tax=Marmoricola sp. RAF53 TaxID=3233059 RepID=UPI003F95EB99